jgi:hypothetical protein
MPNITDVPLLLFAIALVGMWGSIRIGGSFSTRLGTLREDVRKELDTVTASALTLLAFLIGFTSSMAIGRYNERKMFEEAEANAIRTEYFRADLMPVADGAKVRALLRDYLEQRIRFYLTGNAQELRQINARTARLETELWSVVVVSGTVRQGALVALTVSGVNEVLNSRGNAMAARQNRIPLESWGLLAAIAFICALMLGFGARHAKGERVLMSVMPLVVSIAFLLIADVDSPSRGVIRVNPENLAALSGSLSAQ